MIRKLLTQFKDSSNSINPVNPPLASLFPQLYQWVWPGRGIWITVPIATATILCARAIGLLQPWELSLYDVQVRLRSAQPLDDRIIIVSIGENDLQTLGEWPISDQVLAKALTNIKRQGPSVIGLDIYRDLPVPPTDRSGSAALNYIFKSTPNLVGIEKRSLDPQIPPVNPPPLLRPEDQVGVNNFPIDIDGRVRRALLYYDEGDIRYPSFALQVALSYLDQKKIFPDQDGKETLTINGHSFLPFSEEGAYTQADTKGYQILLNYRNESKNFQQVSFQEVMKGKMANGLFKNRIVLIGSTASSLNDRFLTPYSTSFLKPPLPMNGVEIHAHVVSHFLSSALQGRPEIQVWNKLMESIWITTWTTLTALLYWHYRNRRQFSWAREGGLLAIVSAVSGMGQIAFNYGFWLPLAPTLLGMMGGIIGIMAYGSWSAAELRKTFGRYLTAEVVNQLLETPEGLRMGGDRRTVTMLMADLRGFSSASERQAPEQVITFLNQYLEIMTDVITRHQGTIDEFLGDGILVLFGAPNLRSDDADRAVACAVDMQLELTKVNEYAHLMGVTEVEMGIGVHTGEVIVGNIGSLKRAKYGIVGSHMNLTSRIESYTIGGQILISQATNDAMSLTPKLKGLMKVEAKGIQQALTLYEVNGIESVIGGASVVKMLPDRPNALNDLLIPIPVQFAIIEGKHVHEARIHGLLRKISPRGAVFQSSIELVLLTNLKLNLTQPDRTADFYAKVTRLIMSPASTDSAEESMGWLYYLHFTFITPEVLEGLQGTVVRRI